ncbi:MAG: hypothetical protein ACP5RK_01475 [Candidatus Micrarchaeia archaeon]
MEERKEKIRKSREYVIVFLAYLAIASIMLWQLVIHMGNSTIGYGGDTYQGMWDLWWVPYALFTLHTTPYFTNLVYYPVGANLVTQTMSPLLGILSYPLQLVSLPFAMNVILLLGIALSGLFMYIFAKYLTGNVYGSFLAGLIFAFSPEHLVQSIGHLQWNNIEFIPLFLLFFLLMVKERKIKYAVYSSIAFIFVVFAGDVEQGILTALIAFFILLYYLIFDKTERKRILSKRFAFLFVVLVALVLVIGSPGFVPMINGIRSGVLSYTNIQGGIANNMLYSDTLASFLLPAYTNPIFSSMPGYLEFYSKSIVDTAEGTGYMGYSVLFLVFASVYLAFRRKELHKIGLWIFIGAIFFLLAFGPYMRIAGFPTSTVGLVPGLYYIYHAIPLLNVFREPGRFDFAITIVLAVLAAFGFKYLSEKFDKKKLFVLFFVLILIEYWASFPQPVQASIPKAYYYIREIPGNYSLFILPVLPNYSNQTSPMRYQGVELYYQTVFQKPLVGGYTTRYNETQLNVLSEVPLAVEANYLSNVGKFMFVYPITENYTQLTLFMLANFNVGFVGVIRQAYNYTQQLQLASYLYTVFGMPVYQSNSTMIFSTSNAIRANVGRNIVAYTVGNWFPGYFACTSVFCNQTLQEMWWGSNARGIGLFVPRNISRVYMNFSAMYYQGSTNMQIYLNSPNNLIKSIQLYPTAQNYSLSFAVSPGFNMLILLTKNATGQAGNFNFGIMNITFSPA